MMLKRILSLRTSNSTLFLTTGTLATCKIISRTLMEQDIDVVEKWDLLSAVCLERHPVITKPMLEIEIQYQKMLQQIEFENGMISDFEIQKQKQTEQKKEEIDFKNTPSTQAMQDIE